MSFAREAPFFKLRTHASDFFSLFGCSTGFSCTGSASLNLATTDERLPSLSFATMTTSPGAPPRGVRGDAAAPAAAVEAEGSLASTAALGPLGSSESSPAIGGRTILSLLQRFLTSWFIMWNSIAMSFCGRSSVSPFEFASRDARSFDAAMATNERRFSMTLLGCAPSARIGECTTSSSSPPIDGSFDGPRGFPRTTFPSGVPLAASAAAPSLDARRGLARIVFPSGVSTVVAARGFPATVFPPAGSDSDRRGLAFTMTLYVPSGSPAPPSFRDSPSSLLRSSSLEEASSPTVFPMYSALI
eukprot:Opistho-1_new@53099